MQKQPSPSATVAAFYPTGPASSYTTSWDTITAANGVLYGTTENGCGSANAGCVYSITFAGKEKIVYAFKGGTDGGLPFSALLFANSVFVGTTSAGGSAQAGTVFEMTPAGKETVLWPFKGSPDGSSPLAGLTL